MTMTEEHLKTLAHSITSSERTARMPTRKFDGKTYIALGEYFKKVEANEVARKIRAPAKLWIRSRFGARVTTGSYIGSYTVWVRRL